MISTSRSTAPVVLPPGYAIIKVERDEDFQKCADLWSLCFGLNTEFHRESELKFARQPECDVYAVVYGECLCATLVVIEFEMRLNGKFVRCAGIADVATDPSHRRGNLVKALMTHALLRAHEEKIPVAALHAFSHPYYERMGFATTTFSYRIKAPVSWCRLIAKAGDSRNYKLTELKDYSQAAQIHERSLERFNVTLRRNHGRWDIKLHDFGSKVILYCHQDGYMLWNVGKIVPRVLQVPEWNYVSQEALLDGLALFGAMDSQVDFVEWIDGDIRPLLNLGVSYPAPEFELLPKIMTRIVNLEAFEECFGKAPDRITDPLGIAVPLRHSGAEDAGAATSPGVVIQRITGLCGTATSGNPLGVPSGAMPFGPNYCNDFF